ncbi:unnamed protein product [Auanema sp. JU1783]|nr:unnamed protein product [Auanema sp. JU1783]
MDNFTSIHDIDEGDEFRRSIDTKWSYFIEKWIYGISFFLGIFAFLYTFGRLVRSKGKGQIWAARLLSYKISLTVADGIILFIYAPVQLYWISNVWWRGGDTLCGLYKFISTFGIHLTTNMQVLIAYDRLAFAATMRTLRSKRNRNEPYNSRMFLSLVWAIALLCSAPQYFLFSTGKVHFGNFNDTKEQCISIWFRERSRIFEQMQSWRDFEYFEHLKQNESSELYLPDGTLAWVVKKPDFSKEALAIEDSFMYWLEQFFNFIHLATLIAIPYALEATFLWGTVSILSKAEGGTFSSVSELLKANCCPCWCWNLMRERMAASAVRSSSVCGPSLIHRSSSASLDRPAVYQMSSVARHGSLVKKKQSNGIGSVERSSSKKHHEVATGLLLTREMRDRSASCSNVDDILNVQNRLPREVQTIKSDTVVVQAPWKATVSAAKLRARKKAIFMVVANLILWGPYLLLGIISAVIVFDSYVHFQFVSALICFNAIVNIIL